GSPSRASILITSAPKSPSITEATGPCCQIVQSITRMPSSGSAMRGLSHSLAPGGKAPASGPAECLAAEERETNEEVGRAVREENRGRLDDRRGVCTADHEVVVGAHRPRGRERERRVAHPARLELDRPPAPPDSGHGDDD